MRTSLRLSLLVFLAVAFLAIPTQAHAQVLGGGGGDDTVTGPDNQNSSGACDGTMSADECMWSPMGGQSGVYYYCAAKGRWGGVCVDLLLKTGTTNTWQCMNVRYQAHCTCDASTRTARGTCTYEY